MCLRSAAQKCIFPFKGDTGNFSKDAHIKCHKAHLALSQDHNSQKTNSKSACKFAAILCCWPNTLERQASSFRLACLAGWHAWLVSVSICMVCDLVFAQENNC
ncbi:hypothetical protein DUNSADRAFT_3543 [Dunaliella salina]|uniref:Encoded protein n=1 Tax=Dunaliella salina TaxID=3046 RepID=A0ABQ7H7W8_DUNSA|nr:hypothetical protein DUNSADRAFT_3543 [Dunaliella salina]|eukprot:KAF5842950.1 hypothetical protein DUNSADRAFT_3543 [Dunaliella salina]